MRRAIAWFVAGLPFDARSRRAINETLLDWEGEATEALRQAQGRPRWVERTVTEVRGVASIARVTSLSVLRESIDFSWCRGLGRRFGVAGGIVLLLTLAFAVLAAVDYRGSAAPVALLVGPIFMHAVLPPAMFLIVAWRPVSRSTPSVGVAIALTLMVFVLAQWVVPATTGRATELLWQYLKADFEARGIPTTPGYAPRPPIPPIPLNSLSLACLSGAGLVLAGALARRRSLRTWWWLAAVPFFYFFAPAVLRFAAVVALIRIGGFEWRAYVDAPAYLMLAAALATLAAKFGQHQPLGSPRT